MLIVAEEWSLSDEHLFIVFHMQKQVCKIMLFMLCTSFLIFNGKGYHEIDFPAFHDGRTSGERGEWKQSTENM